MGTPTGLPWHHMLTLTCALLLAACSPTSQPTPVAAPGTSTGPSVQPPPKVESSAPRTSLTIGYGAVSGTNAPLWIALEAKLFEKYGLDVELISLPGVSGPQALIAGQVPLVTLAGFAAVPSMIEGADLLMISSSINRMTTQLYSVPGIDSPQALRGKRIGITRPGTLTHFAALLALREWGLKADEDVAIVSMNDVPSILSGLLAGAVDVGVLTDPTTLAASKQGYHLLADLSDFPTEYLTLGFTTTWTYAQQNRPILLNVLRSYVEGHKRYLDDKPFAIEILKKYSQIEDAEILDKTYTSYAEKYFLKVPLPTVRSIQSILDDYALGNPRAKEVDANRLVDPSLVQELQREGFFRSLGME
jgi:ABC-type nitrate/sulfonate/bicarbonate transport system substrate-binding protein